MIQINQNADGACSVQYCGDSASGGHSVTLHPPRHRARENYLQALESKRVERRWNRALGTVIAGVFLVGLLGGCAEPQVQVPYRAVTDSKQFMNWVLDPQADVIWGSAGVVSTLEGERDLRPTTQEDWDAVRNAAATIAEAGNLLMMPGHARAGADWNEISQGLTAKGMELVAAAENKDADAIFELGGHLYNICVACHQLYVYPDGDQGE